MSMRAIHLSVVCGLALAGCKDPISSSPPPRGDKDAAGKTAGTDTASASPGKAAPAAPGQGITTALTSGTGAPTPSSASPETRARAKAEGFVRTASGLEYQILAEGQGETPPLGSRVLVNYTGMLPNGETFVSTRERGAPQEFKLDGMRLIGGWVEALLSMKKGEKRKLLVPSALAYGQKGYPGLVLPNSNLTFELELVAFTPPGAGKAPR
jgi:peptidylprolyl isomerase